MLPRAKFAKKIDTYVLRDYIIQQDVSFWFRCFTFGERITMSGRQGRGGYSNQRNGKGRRAPEEAKKKAVVHGHVTMKHRVKAAQQPDQVQRASKSVQGDLALRNKGFGWSNL